MRHRASCSTTCRYVIGTIIIAMMSSLSAIADTYYGPKDYSIVPPLPCAASERQYGAEGEGVSQTMWTYRYDGFGRLAEASATDAVSAPDRALGEVFEYDRNSNILSLERVYAGEPVQDAAMSYVGNRLTGVNDASMPYNKDIVPSFAAGTYALEYDGDGRLVADGTRGITDIKYTTDGMGLPTRIDLSADNKVYSSYLPDGTLIARDFRSVRTRTTVRVNSKGDTIVRTIREPVIDRTLYRGDWEISGYPGSGGWRINTPEGIASIVRNGADAAGRTFTHLWYVRDRLGSVRTVVDDEGTIRQCTMYYPSGLPVQLFGTERVTDRAHIGNRWSNFAGLGWHDNIDRWHDAILDRFTSPYTHCAANPLRFTDPTGMWTVKVSASPGRQAHPYALYSVYSQDNLLVFRTVVLVKGSHNGPRDRTNGDTPQGEYEILGWRKLGPGTNYRTESFGKNPLLAQHYLGGEGGPNRDGMHTHGGRPRSNKLVNTNGCIRMSDDDIAALKQVTDALTRSNPDDKPGILTVTDDLLSPITFDDMDKLRLIEFNELDTIVVTPENNPDKTDFWTPILDIINQLFFNGK